MSAESLPDQSLDPIAIVGFVHFSTDGDAYAHGIGGSAARIHNEMRRDETVVAALDCEKLSPSTQPQPLREAFVRQAHFLYVDTDSRLRPFARRRLMTARPDLVCMRARKPWVRRRDTLLG